jgi:hypothetical protein
MDGNDSKRTRATSINPILGGGGMEKGIKTNVTSVHL